VILRLGGVMLSVLLHVALVTLLLAWSATDWTRPVFVDLGEGADSPGSSTADPSPARSARPAARAAGSAPAPARAPAVPEPVAPAASRAPAPAPAPLAGEPHPVAPVAPPAPAITVEPVPAPSAALVPALPGAPSASSAASGPADGRVGATGSGAGAGSGAQTRGDADRGSGGAPGSPIALATPGPGGSGAPPPEYGPYLRHFRQRVQESLIYPLAARRQGLGGTVELHVWLEATGRVRDVQVARSSSHSVLDAAAVETIRRLGPMPFPDSLPRRPLLIRLPLVYELR
jgi:protein TonB